MVDFFKANRSKFEEDMDEAFEEEMADYDSEEKIYAGYLQSKNQIGNLQLLFGVRYEQTTLENTGNLIQFDEDGDYESTLNVSQEREYSHVFPMAHLRYRTTPQTNIRLALTRSIARPNHYDLVPFIFANREDEELERGNPDLEPTLSMNADFMAEHYLSSLGIVSAGLFYKSIEKPIYWRVSAQTSGPFNGYESLTPLNGGHADLMGIEVAWQQQLGFLPGVLNGLGVYVNYTYTWSEAELEGYEDPIQLPGQAQNMANVALSYEKYGFSGRIAMNYHGNFIDEVGEEGDDDHVYYDNHLQFDVSASYQILPNLSVFGEVINLTNEPLRYTYGDTDIPKQQEYYKWWSHFGIKYHM
jgi:TonB-dependent receptor